MEKGIALLGGFGGFLYGLALMSAALTDFAKKRLAYTRAFSTANAENVEKAPAFSGMLRWAAIGIGVTAVLQSSGAVTVFAVQAAAAGLLPAAYAAALCWGANLGTTATGQLLRLSLAGGAAAPVLRTGCCIAGSALALLGKGISRLAGRCLLGLGLTFTGLAAIRQGLGGDLSGVPACLAALPGPAAAVGLGALLSAVMQSSSGAVGLVQAAAEQGWLCCRSAAALVMGINLGTCTTAFFTAAAAKENRAAALRIAMAHLGFNLFGCAWAGAAMFVLRGWHRWAEKAAFAEVADVHTMFNAVTLVLLLGICGIKMGRQKADPKRQKINPCGKKPSAEAPGRNQAAPDSWRKKP